METSIQSRLEKRHIPLSLSDAVESFRERALFYRYDRQGYLTEKVEGNENQNENYITWRDSG